jgi:hypothetical protein
MSPTGWGCGRMPERQHQRCGVRCDAAAANGSSQGGSSQPAVSVGNGDCWQRACPWVPVVPTAAQKIWPISRRLLEDVEPQSPKLARVPCPHLVIGRRSFCSASPLLPQNPPAPGVIAPLPRCIAAAPTRAPLPAPQQLHSSSPLHLPLPRRCPLPLPLFLLAPLFVSCCLAPSLRLGPRSSIPAIPAPLANPTSKSATDPSPPPSQCPSLPTTPMRYLPSTAKS